MVTAIILFVLSIIPVFSRLGTRNTLEAKQRIELCHDPYERSAYTSNIAILAHLNIIIWDDSAPINLHLNADWCRYWTIDGGDDGFALYPSSGSSDLPVATINGPAPVAVVNTEWGAIKAMYR